MLKIQNTAVEESANCYLFLDFLEAVYEILFENMSIKKDSNIANHVKYKYIMRC